MLARTRWRIFQALAFPHEFRAFWRNILPAKCPKKQTEKARTVGPANAGPAEFSQPGGRLLAAVFHAAPISPTFLKQDQDKRAAGRFWVGLAGKKLCGRRPFLILPASGARENISPSRGARAG